MWWVGASLFPKPAKENSPSGSEYTYHNVHGSLGSSVVEGNYSWFWSIYNGTPCQWRRGSPPFLLSENMLNTTDTIIIDSFISLDTYSSNSPCKLIL